MRELPEAAPISARVSLDSSELIRQTAGIVAIGGRVTDTDEFAVEKPIARQPHVSERPSVVVLMVGDDRRRIEAQTNQAAFNRDGGPSRRLRVQEARSSRDSRCR